MKKTEMIKTKKTAYGLRKREIKGQDAVRDWEGILGKNILSPF